MLTRTEITNGVSVTPELDLKFGRWREIPFGEVVGFNGVLLRTSADVLQYPYWNEPYRRLGLKPWFLTWAIGDEPEVYVCVLSVGWGRLRIGLVLRGPVALTKPGEVPTAALVSLCQWARANGFIFIRFTHSDASLLQRIAGLTHSSRSDAFPLYRDTAAAFDEVIIDQCGDDNAILASFDKEIRRQIRRGVEAGYVIRAEDTLAAMERAWPLIVGCSRRKGFPLQRRLSTYLEMVRTARLYGCVRIYTVSIGEKDVEVGIFFRSRDTALNLLGARDPDALKGHPSPTPLLHWRAMRDLWRAGAVFYNLGLAVGNVGRFKMQFGPRIHTYPPPVTVILNRRLYGLWAHVGRPFTSVFSKPLSWLAAQLQRLGED